MLVPVAASLDEERVQEKEACSGVAEGPRHQAARLGHPDFWAGRALWPTGPGSA